MRIHNRHVILHYHIFKNAGTTIFWILQRNFGKHLAALEGDHFNGRLGNDVLLEFLRKHPKVQAVSSHQLWPPPPEHEGFVFCDILLLRNPLTRLSSIYDFFRRSPVTKDPLTAEAKKRSTSDFMRLLINEYPHQVDNPQVNYLSARNRNSSESMLNVASRIACQATVLGTTELFDVCAVLAEYSLSPFFGALNFGYVAQNVSSMAPRDLELHLAQFRDACGSDTYEQLLKLNAMDLELLEMVRTEVLRRFERLADREQRLKHFRLWRSILHPSSVRGVLASNHPHDFIQYANFGIH